MKTHIPRQEKKQWSQLNRGDLLGTLFATRNIDLETTGVIKLAQRTRYVGRSTSSFTDCNAIVYGSFNSTPQYWMIMASGGVFTLGVDLTGFAVDGLSNTPSTHSGSDGCMWNGNLYVTKTARVAKLASGTWTTNWSSADFTTITSGTHHPIEPNVTNNNLLVGDVNLLKKVDSSGTITTALTLPSEYTIIWIKRGVNVNYIGLDIASSGTFGAVAIWDGLDTTIEANAIIPISSRTPLCGILDEQGVFNILQSDGRLMKYNGSGFVYEAELPPYRDFLLRQNWGNTATGFSKVSRRGIALIKGKIHINIDVSNDTSTYNSNFHSGVWVYDSENNAFYHKSALSYSNTVTDFGASIPALGGGALYPIIERTSGSLSQPSTSVGGSYLVGSRIYDGTSTSYRCICSATTGENRGSFVTTRIESPNITSKNLSVICKYEGVNTSTDKIIFKYRTSYRIPYTIGPIGGDLTWTSTTTFTSSDTNLANAVVGDEITVLYGNGAGCTAHITNISLVTTTYTITLDEAITGISVSNAGYVLLENWKKINNSITYIDTSGYKSISFPIQANTPWIQIKVEMRGEGRTVGVQELIYDSKLNEVDN